MTKAQLKEELKGFGLVEGEDYQSDTSNKDLAKMLAKAVEDADADVDDEDEDGKGTGELGVEDKEENENEDEEEEEILGPQHKKNKLKYNGKGSIDIIKGGRFIRSYHEEAHGEGFKKMAKGFINKNTNPETKKTNFKMVNTFDIKSLLVEYSEIDKKGRQQKHAVKFGASIEEKERAVQLAAEKCVGVVIV